MKLTITSIELKSPFKFFPLSHYAMKILGQLKATNCVEFKKQGVWTLHYTMTLWSSEQDLKTFAMSGEHLKAMQKSKNLAKEIKTLTIDADQMPDWETAKKLLDEQGKTIRY